MTTPTLYPTEFQGTDLDYLNAPQVDRSGAMRLYTNTISIPDTTSSGTIIGLMPFNKGARLGYGSVVAFGDFDTASNVTANVGWVYDDNDTVTNVNDVDGFIAASTAPQAGGLAEFSAVAGVNFEATANGWVMCQFTADTTTAASVTYNLNVGYSG